MHTKQVFLSCFGAKKLAKTVSYYLRVVNDLLYFSLKIFHSNLLFVPGWVNKAFTVVASFSSHLGLQTIAAATPTWKYRQTKQTKKKNWRKKQKIIILQ